MLEIEIIEVSVTQMGFALMLKPPNKEKVVPVFIGPLETYSISGILEGQKFERPLTHDLTKTMLQNLDQEVRKIVIDDFKEGTFYAKLYLAPAEKEAEAIEIDCRPSDAIALALRFQAPIYMLEHVYDATSIDSNLIKEKTKTNDKSDEKDEIIQNIIDEFGAPPPPPVEKPRDTKRTDERHSSHQEGDQYLTKEEVLKQMLKAAISKEDYEEAARIRDEISKLRPRNEIKRNEIKRDEIQRDEIQN